MWWFFNEKNKYINNEPDVKRVNEDETEEEEEEPKHRTFLDKLFHKDEEEQEEDEEEINEQIAINLNNTSKIGKSHSTGMVVPDIHIGEKTKKCAGVTSIRDIDADSTEELFTKKKKEKLEEVSEELNLQHGLTEEEYNYEFPKIEILDKDNELKEIVQSKEFTETQSKAILGLKGASITKIIDFKDTSHILIAGADETGKTNLLDNIIINTIYKANPSETKLLIIDTNGNGLTKQLQI